MPTPLHLRAPIATTRQSAEPTTVEAMADAARKGMARMNLDKKKGSISHDRKHKSLRERWLSREPKPTGIEANDVNPSEKVN